MVEDVDAESTLDAATTCEAGEVPCTDGCVRVAEDSNNCGSCGNVCPEGSSCAIGRCDCFAPLLGCGGVCLDPRTDTANCGTCGNRCAGTELCVDGECVLDCDAPNVVCTNEGEDGEDVLVCADLQTDPMNCGTCNTKCSEGTVCLAGFCQCAPGALLCGRSCVDVTLDANNCGSCGISCGMGGVCVDSACTSCGADREACSGRCVNLDTDPFNCGSCGRRCGTRETCTDGLCDCVTGFLDCGGCTNPMTDAENCGSCGNSCGPGGVCSGGMCTCAEGLTMCGTSCHDLQTSLDHCGECDNECPALIGGVCAGGECGCPAGTTDCGGTCFNTSTSAAHCGACDVACDAGDVCLMSECTDAPPIRYEREDPAPELVPYIDACAAPGMMGVLAGADDQTTTVNLPFPFRYWATDLAAGSPVAVSSNGWISLAGPAAFSSSGPVPSTSTPNGVVAVFSRDLVLRGPICIATVGEAPNRQWVVEFREVRNWLGGDEQRFTFEIILSEATRTIDFVYQSMMGASSTAYVGIENQTGMQGINACPGGTGMCIPTAGQRIRFNPIP